MHLLIMSLLFSAYKVHRDLCHVKKEKDESRASIVEHQPMLQVVIFHVATYPGCLVPPMSGRHQWWRQRLQGLGWDELVERDRKETVEWWNSPLYAILQNILRVLQNDLKININDHLFKDKSQHRCGFKRRLVRIAVTEFINFSYKGKLFFVFPPPPQFCTFLAYSSCILWMF